MGLFDIFRSKKKEPIIDVLELPNYTEIQEHLNYQSELLSKVGEASNLYKENGDIEALIKAYEFAFIESDPPCHTSQNLKLVDLYIKTGQNNKAWSYLNQLIYTNEAPIEKIRHEQARILKKEKRYIPALDMITAEYLLRCSFNREAFIKDAGVCIRALKWDESILNDIADMITDQRETKDIDESKLHNTLKQYLQNRGLLKEG